MENSFNLIEKELYERRFKILEILNRAIDRKTFIMSDMRLLNILVPSLMFNRKTIDAPKSLLNFKYLNLMNNGADILIDNEYGVNKMVSYCADKASQIILVDDYDNEEKIKDFKEVYNELMSKKDKVLNYFN